jgi:hypothetical protein
MHLRQTILMDVSSKQTRDKLLSYLMIRVEDARFITIKQMEKVVTGMTANASICNMKVLMRRL